MPLAELAEKGTDRAVDKMLSRILDAPDGHHSTDVSSFNSAL